MTKMTRLSMAQKFGLIVGTVYVLIYAVLATIGIAFLALLGTFQTAGIAAIILLGIAVFVIGFITGWFIFKASELIGSLTGGQHLAVINGILFVLVDFVESGFDPGGAVVGFLIGYFSYKLVEHPKVQRV
jgi:hypothetical protein